VRPRIRDEVQEAALFMFGRAQEVAESNGLIIMDTKMEFGLDSNGKVMVIDELFTPDSSRFVRADSYRQRMTGYSGEGDAPPIPEALARETALRYLLAYGMITGTPFEIPTINVRERVEANLAGYLDTVH